MCSKINRNKKSLNSKNSLIFFTIFVGLISSFLLAYRQNQESKGKNEAENVTMDELIARAQQKVTETKEIFKNVKLWQVSEFYKMLGVTPFTNYALIDLVKP